jgi:hypothetical protein
MTAARQRSIDPGNASVTQDLFCVECMARTHEFERGWCGFLTDDECEPEEVAMLCPACAEREFGAPCRTNRDEAD